jgi:LuxR family maltose regulon positive regulatory protein
MTDTLLTPKHCLVVALYDILIGVGDEMVLGVKPLAGRICMPRSPIHALRWSETSGTYELITHGQFFQYFALDDEEAWSAWLTDQTSFSFQGQHGHLSLLKEPRPRGEGYWYAYHYTPQMSSKRYVGRPAAMTLARLEQIAQSFQSSTRPKTSTAVTTVQDSEKGIPHLPQAAEVPALPLLTPKLHPPKLPPSIIERSRLLAQLDAWQHYRVTLIQAPAGFGKTTLVGHWIALHHADPHFPAVAWVSLEEEDNDPVQFWRYMITASQDFQPDLGQTSLALLAHAQQPSIIDILTLWLNELDHLPHKGLLILDDYHVINEPDIHAAMTYFIEHLPASLHLILLSRSEPPLSLVRWHARGAIQRIATSDLRFEAEETAIFLGQELTYPLSEQTIQRLNSHLEGWPVGLRLLLLTLQGQANLQEVEHHLTSLAGHQHLLLDYFVNEVLVSQPETVQHFLLQTSVLSRLTGSLCNEVLKMQESESLLTTVERAGLFLTTLDMGRQWYRYHRLFAEAMHAEAQRRLGEHILREISLRASQWYEQRGFLSDAIEAALKAEAFERGAGLIERILIPQSWRNEYHTLRRWLALLPEDLLQTHPDLSLAYAMALYFTSDRSAAQTRQRMQKPLQMAEQGLEGTPNQNKRGAVLVLRAHLSFFHGDFLHAFHLARLALTLLPKEDRQWHAPTLTLIALEEALSGQVIKARQTALQARILCEAAESLPASLMATLALGEASFGKGDLHQAARYYSQVLVRGTERQDLVQLQLTRETGTKESFYERQALYGLAQLSYEWNDLEAASQYLQKSGELGRSPAEEVHLLVAGGLLLARLCYARGEIQQALEALTECEALVHSPQFLREIRACQARIELALGNQSPLEHWSATYMQHNEDLPFMRREEEALLFIRLQIAQEKADKVFNLLAPWKAAAKTQERGHSLLEMLILETQAHFKQKDFSQATTTLIEALTLAQPEDYQRLFLDEGKGMETLLKTTLLDIRDASLASYARRLLLAFAREQGQEEPYGVERPLFEPLSPQELRVLRLLASGRSNPEIARELVVSLNTIKTQVRSIYRKLGVNTRQEACDVARQYHLL